MAGGRRIMKEKLDSRLKHLYENLKLTVELVPSTCWWSNVRSNLKSSQWDKIRRIIYKRSDYKCDVCGGKGITYPVECHEVWEYNDEEKIQRLKGFMALCPPCHMVKHIGLAGLKGNAEIVHERFKKINGLSDEDAMILIGYSWMKWEERSEHEWKLDVSILKDFGIDIGEIELTSYPR